MAVKAYPRGELQPGDAVDIYLRISRDPGHDELGVKRQERECRDLCERRGWRIAKVHRDDDRSAFSGKTREGYEELLQRVKLGHVRGIVAWHPDRLHRSPKELERFIDIVEAHGAGVITVQGGEYDLSTASGRMSARIVGAVARSESEHKSERILAKMNELRRDNKFTGGGRRPYGYEARARKSQEQAIREDEAEIIRELTRRRLGGESLLSLVRDLNQRGVPAATGKPWGLASMSRLLRSLRIAGLRINEKGVAAPAPWPDIISKRDHQQLRLLLDRNSRAGLRSQRSYLLTGGLVRCGGCGAVMIGRPINGHPTYCCIKEKGKHPRFKGCSKVFARAHAVDEVVMERVIAVVDTPKLGQRLKRLRSGQQPDHALDAIADQEKRLREIEDDYANGQTERAEYRRLRDQAKARLEELRAGFTPTPTLDYGEGTLRDAWPELSLGRRRAVLDVLLDEVTILPFSKLPGVKKGQGSGPRLDSRRVALKWKV